MMKRHTSHTLRLISHCLHSHSRALGIWVLLLIIGVVAPVHALTPQDIDDVNNGLSWYDSSAGICSPLDTGAPSSPNAGSQSGIWQSGLTAPFILEQFAIETLKDVAKKKDANADSAVTQEHVIALVAFMFGEGGDINNNDLFNPLNTGINAPDLLDGSHSGSGLQSFKSFDAGVEATARTMVLTTQSRLSEVLVQSDSSAEDFMKALTYYQDYQDNKEWAEASMPPNQDSYYRQRLSLVQQIRTNYGDTAGLVLGTPAKEALLNITEKSKLHYHPDGDTSNPGDANGASSSSSDSCASRGAGVIAGDIVATAKSLAWPSSGHGNQQSDATPAYQAAEVKYNGSTSDLPFSDCGVFVSTVMRATGADLDYPLRGTGTQLDYLRTHPNLYQLNDNAQSTADLQPGDILIFSDDPYGHTYIYTGTYLGSDGQTYNAAAASLHQHVPEASSAYFDQNGSHFTVARLIKGGNL